MKNIIILLCLICLVGWLNRPGIVTAQPEQAGTSETRSDYLDYLGLGKDISLTIGLQSGYIKGDTTYRISFSGGESELEFPLNNSLLGIQIGLAFRNSQTDQYDKARLTLKWFTNISEKAGKMKDSDWIVDDVGFLAYYGISGYPHAGLDIYSESDAELDANIIDLNYIWNLSFHQNIIIGAMLGYRYQKFTYDIKNLKQVGYGPYGPGYYNQTGSVSGLVLEYEVKYKFHYIGLNADILLGERCLLNLQAGYSGAVKASDVDDHILRYKLAKGSCNGTAYLVNLNARWKFSDHWSFQIGGEYVDINTKGTQEQYFYGGSEAGTGAIGIPDKITASFLTGSLGIEYRF